MINPDDLRKAYQTFFVESEEGKHCLDELDRLIDDAHKAAEKNPELSRDFVQHARGVRKAKESITNVLLEVKKKK